MRFSRHRRCSATFILKLVVVCIALLAVPRPILAENVICDPNIDSENYYCRGWQDGVGPDGERIRFIARMIGEEQGDDFAYEIASLGDINADGRGDFMVWAKNKCEWRVYLGDTLIARTPYLVWPRCSPASPGHFFSTPDISGDGEPDLIRNLSTTPKSVEIYFAGSAFDTLPDLTISDADFVFPGGAGKNAAAGLDLNGDGQPDFVLGDPSFRQGTPEQYGRAYVYWGGNELDSIPDLILTDTHWVGQNQPLSVGHAIALIPSINGDPSAELVLGRASNSSIKDPLGRVDIFYGGPTMDTVRDLCLIAPDTAYSALCMYIPATGFGGYVEDLGDVNLDGYDDLYISGGGCVPAYIYYGGSDFDTVVDLRVTQPYPSPNGEGDGGTSLGDVNGDGHDDFCLVRRADDLFGGWVNIYYSSSMPTGVVDWIIAGDDWLLTASEFGRSTTSLGDVDGDGYDDIAVGMETAYVDEQNEGGMYIFAGFPSDNGTGVFDEPDAPLPSRPHLIESMAPNPFNSGTTIRLGKSFIGGEVVVYNILGQAVRAFDIVANHAAREIEWDGTDGDGTALSSGLYFIRASDGVNFETEKAVLLK